MMTMTMMTIMTVSEVCTVGIYPCLTAEPSVLKCRQTDERTDRHRPDSSLLDLDCACLYHRLSVSDFTTWPTVHNYTHYTLSTTRFTAAAATTDTTSYTLSL